MKFEKDYKGKPKIYVKEFNLSEVQIKFLDVNGKEVILSDDLNKSWRTIPMRTHKFSVNAPGIGEEEVVWLEISRMDYRETNTVKIRIGHYKISPPNFV